MNESIKDLAKFIFFILPVLILIVYINLVVDPSNIFKVRSYEKEVLKTLQSGKNVAANVSLSQLDERTVLKRYVPVLNYTPEVLVLGNSRSYVLHKELFPGYKFFNASIGSSAFGTIFAVYYLFIENHKIPKKVILCLDTDHFSLSPLPTRDHLWSEFVSMIQIMGVQLSLMEKLNLTYIYIQRKLSVILELFSPAYFQDSLKFWEVKRSFQKRNLGSYSNKKFYREDLIARNIGKIEFYPTDEEDADGGVLFPDFSKNFQIYYRIQNNKQTSIRVKRELTKVERFKQAPIIRNDSKEFFEKFVDYLLSQNINVYIYIMPLHPEAYEFENNLFKGNSAPIITEKYIRNFAAERKIKVIGSNDPAVSGFTESDFFDHRHIFRKAIKKIDWEKFIAESS